MNLPKRRKLEQNIDIKNSAFFPILPDELTKPIPLIDVYIDTILEPKFISKIVVELNSAFPLPQLSHLKRVKGRDIILMVCDDISATTIHDYMKNKLIDTSFFKNNIRKVSVAKFSPKTREQYNSVHQLWPCNFHSNKYIERLCTNTVFSNAEIEQHVIFMKIAIDISRYSCNEKCLGVIIVDTKLNSVVAVGFDKRNDNPTQHAVMDAICNVALTQLPFSDDKVETFSNDLDVRGIPQTILAELIRKYETIKFGASKFKRKIEISSPSDGPYLCTNYTVYSTCEPCIMCAMALIHSRVKRVFYGRNSTNGGLGSLCAVHTIKDLNHHYEVFAGLLADECSISC